MSIKDFAKEQREAIIDLVTLAMYADGHIASAENQRINRLLEEMGLSGEYERNQAYDGAVARVRQHLATRDTIRTHASTLAKAFASAEQRQTVLKLLRELLASDGRVGARESSFLVIATQALEQ